MRSLWYLIFTLALYTGGQISSVHAEQRLALVIGNSSYRNVTPLPNPANDARLIAASLQAAGFEIMGGEVQIDVNRGQLESLIRDFGHQLTSETIGLFYYAGHGVQVGGHNYLVPIEANVYSASDVKYELIDADFVLDEMTAAGNRLNLLLLDACRNNPFAGRGLRDVSRGLAQITAPSGTIIGYATQPGAVAADGDGSNSPYSAALARNISRPGTGVLDTLNNVGVEVQFATSGRQLPWLALSPLKGQFSFTSPTTAIAATSVSRPAAPSDPSKTQQTEAVPTTEPTPHGASVSANRMMEFCPENYVGFSPDGPPLTCGCTADAVNPGNGSLFGDQIYAGTSKLCLAARHAGAVSARGGQITVVPTATPTEEPAFPSVMRNGIQSSRGIANGTSFRIAMAPAPVRRTDAFGRPVQAPIASTLRSEGRVQVYINFDTDKASLQTSSEPVLHELLITLTSQPGLRIDLVGHTDSAGSAAHNQDLSERRAATVYLWLVQHGISRDRLRSSGRGMTEPIADNANAEGRTLNRRVEVKALT